MNGRKRIQLLPSEEIARRSYSVKKLLRNGAPNFYSVSCQIDDNRFFDNLFIDKVPNFFNNVWFPHSNKELQKSIEKYAKFPIATDHGKKQPRLLVFSVDVSEGETVTFDSYPKADGSRKSEYGTYIDERGYENRINYGDGVSINHVMAGATIPEFYDYQIIEGRKFWDGGLLSNTPFRELLQAHQQYWTDVVAEKNIPDLEVYIVNLHSSKQPNPPIEHDGVKDRQNDIIFGDRNSHYDERLANLETDLRDFITQMETLLTEAISKVSKESDQNELKIKFEDILTTIAISKGSKGEFRKYKNLLSGRFKLTKVLRIEHTNYINSISGKGGDLTFQTISKLIKEGEIDAWLTLIQADIDHMILSPDISANIQSILTNKLKQIEKTLKDSDYQNTTEACSEHAEFMDEVGKKKQVIDKLRPGQSDKLRKSAEEFKTLV